MQPPVLIFDHVGKAAATVAAGPDAEKKLAEFAALQLEQVATSGRPIR